MPKENICKNCNHTFEGKYCNECGQSAKTGRLNFHFLIHEIEHGIFHFDHGILYTLKRLFTTPGKSIRGYLAGQRANLTSPFTTVVLVATVYALLSHYIKHQDVDAASADKDAFAILKEWINNHYVWFTMLTIPLYSVGTFLAFKKQGYNFVEYMALNSYKASQRLFTHLFTLPFIVFFSHSENLYKLYIVLYTCDIGLTYWTNFLFFNKLHKVKVLFLTLLSHFIFLTLLFLIIQLLHLIF